MDYHPSSPLSQAQLEEFKELVKATGLCCQGVLYQVIKKVQPATFIGAGKVQEIKAKINGEAGFDGKTHPEGKSHLEGKSHPKNKPYNSRVEIVVFDFPLSGVQIRNLEKELKVMVIDRHQLILEIFAGRARTYEGKLQVELARALDELPRMVGAWMSSLSRQGGGIGTKGPGEKAIEKDRRVIQRRVKKIRQKLDKVRQVRKSHRALRKKNKIPHIALIGYTNAGKSALLNVLSKSHSAQVKNLPFMTLDPTIRKWHINSSQTALLTDTVGFIQNLSPHLIEAFKATLEESAEADLLLHIIDGHSPLMAIHIQTVQKIIKDLGWDQKPCIQVYNKIDLLSKNQKLFKPNKFEKKLGLKNYPYLSERFNTSKQNQYKNTSAGITIQNRNWGHMAPLNNKPVYSTAYYHKVFVSAKTGEGLNKLKTILSKKLAYLDMEEVQFYFPQDQEEKVYLLTKTATLLKKEVSSLGTLCQARIHRNQLKEWAPFIVP